MSVYKNDRPDYFCLAVDSMLQQTLKPDEIILVVDGPVSQELETAIRGYRKKIKAIWLEKNKGLWNALNVGLKKAKNELIARMDSDDVSCLDRLEKQVAEFKKDSDLDIVGGQIAEFQGNVNNVVSYRKVPLEQEDIKKFARFRSPFNHPAVMYKKSSVLTVGGYSEFYRTEDYDLWLRMLQNGAKCKNLPDVILNYRISDSNMSRRTNKVNYQEMVKIYKRSYKDGFLSLFEYCFIRLMRLLFYYSPNFLKYGIYKRFLRNEK